jgi:AcrR family transcriptional regulator
MAAAPTRSLPRQARRRQQTRTAILSAGEQLFAGRSVDSVSIDDIVMAADVAKGSFYNHFEDKADLASAVFELIQGDCEFHIQSANRDIADPGQRVVRALCVMLRYALDHPERLSAINSLSERKTIAQSPLNRGLSLDIKEGLETGRMRGIDLEVGVISVLGLINVSTRHLLTSGTAKSPMALGAITGAALLRALGVDDADTLARATAEEILSPLLAPSRNSPTAGAVS